MDDITGIKKYNLAVAFIRFKEAYKQLIECGKALPEVDVSEEYPFFLLDLEAIEKNVVMWCTVHAYKLLQELPDKVDNPACIKCSFFRKGLGADGQCKGLSTIKCGLYPLVLFSREIAIPVFVDSEVDAKTLTDKELQLYYMQRMDALYEKTKQSNDT